MNTPNKLLLNGLAAGLAFSFHPSTTAASPGEKGGANTEYAIEKAQAMGVTANEFISDDMRAQVQRAGGKHLVNRLANGVVIVALKGKHQEGNLFDFAVYDGNQHTVTTSASTSNRSGVRNEVETVWGLSEAANNQVVSDMEATKLTPKEIKRAVVMGGELLRLDVSTDAMQAAEDSLIFHEGGAYFTRVNPNGTMVPAAEATRKQANQVAHEAQAALDAMTHMSV